MISSIVHQPCEVSLHLYSSDIFVHPPRPNNDLPGDDKTLHGLVEIRVPSERTIASVRVTFSGHQTLAIPERAPDSAIVTTRYEDKVLMEKVVEINTDSVRATSKKGKGKEKHLDAASTVNADGQVTMTEVQGIHLDKGVHGFEFAFIVPATSAPFERAKLGRVRYTLTATAIGAGRGRANVSTSREIFIIAQVNADGGPVPLDIQYHDAHEALGPLSISLTTPSLTVGGAATLSMYHPSPPPGLSVHVVRVFLEQTIELYSEVRKAWMKLPVEKLRLWERGYMPNREAIKQVDPSALMEDCFWIRNEQDPTLPGHAGRSVIAGGFGVPTLAPYGTTMHPGLIGGPAGASASPANGSYQASPSHSHPPTPGGSGTPNTHSNDGYKLKAVLRLPDDNHMRPSSVRGSRAEIRISHEMGVEIFFSRASVLDDRPNSETFGKPKVQVFSMRRATIVPSCFATFDQIHLPPYSLESPMSSRPPSPGPGSATSRGRATATAIPQSTQPRPDASQSEIDHWRLTQTLKAALGGHANSGSGASGAHSAEQSQPASGAASRSSSPTRSSSTGGGAFANTLGYFSQHHHGRRSRPSSPTREHGGSGHHSPQAVVVPSSSTRKSGPSSLHALTPTHNAKPTSTLAGYGSSSSHQAPHHHPHATNNHPTVITAPASGTTTPKTLPVNAPWAATSFPVRSGTSHESCQCGRSTEELIEAERRLLEGAPTAPGIWIDAHDEGQLPPPWTPSRPASPVLDTNDVSGWYRGENGEREGGRARGKIGEMLGAISLNGEDVNRPETSTISQHAVAEQDSDDDGGLM